MRKLTPTEMEFILGIAAEAGCDRDGDIMHILVNQDLGIAKVITLSDVPRKPQSTHVFEEQKLTTPRCSGKTTNIIYSFDKPVIYSDGKGVTKYEEGE